MSLFDKKFINKRITVSPNPDAARVAAFKEWAADIKSGKIATHSEVSLHGPFVQKYWSTLSVIPGQSVTLRIM